MEDKIINLLNQLVTTESIYPNELKIGKLIYNLILKNKIKIKLQNVENNRKNILAEKGDGRKSILLYGHLDTVGVARGWKTDPFKLTIKNDKVYGLGAWDMKGGLAINILTFLNYHPKNFKLKLALVVDEENISKGGFKVLRSNFGSDVNCIISTEPGFHYGLQGITIGRVGRAVFKVEITCPSKHYIFYEEKFDPTIVAANFINELKKFNFKKNKKKQFLFIRKIESSTKGMSIPEKIYLEIDSAILPPTKNEEILKKLIKKGKEIAKKYKNYFNIKIDFVKRETPFLNSYLIKTNNFYLKFLSESIKEVTKKEPIPYFRSSIADENIFGSAGYTILGIGPEGGNAHSANEWVSLTSLVKLYQILNVFLKKIDENSI
ncbi:MAG: M20 family metallopeptidase [Microgenomates group bacterium]